MRKNKGKFLASILAFLGIMSIAFFFVYGMVNKPIYMVTFNTDGGSIVANVEVEEGNRVEMPSNPIKEGYDFIRWDYNNVPFDFNTEITSDITLYAVWEQKIIEPQKYNVTFKLDDEVISIEATDFSEINIDGLGFKTKKDHLIIWYLDGIEYDTGKPLRNDITLEGKYVKIENFTIKFNSDGGTSIKNQTVKTGEKVIEPSNVTKDGYVLDGWYLNSEKYDFDKKVYRSFTLVAKWTEDSNIKWYTVDFDSAGGSDVKTQRIRENKTASKPTNPTKKGFLFVDWFYNDKAFDFKSKITSDVSLVAKWREPEKYQVVFQYDDGKEYLKKEVKEGETVSKPNDPTKENNVFNGWQLDGKAFDFNTKISKNVILIAKFTPNSSDCEITFETDGGTKIPSRTIKCGTTTTKPSDPVKIGYKLIKWTFNGSDFDFATPINSNITLKAVYEEKNYTVTFDSNGGSNVTSRVIGYGDKISNPPIPTRENYLFVEWQQDSNKFDFDNTTITSDITLKAKWESLDDCGNDEGCLYVPEKPLIYLYPEKEMDVEVKLGNINDVTTIYPKYNNGWKVTASSNGKLIDKNTGRELYGLYWEGKNYHSKDIDEGFLVKGSDTIDFLEEKLAILGLNEREAEEFIIYWLPQMEHNNYNFIRFAEKKEIDNYMPLEINPKPDTVIRILMEFMPLDKMITVREQKLEKVTRIGFTAVEWGGLVLKGKTVR